MSGDPFDLARFVSAQAGVFDRALEELRAGAKRSHWIWFVFPQLKTLGRSQTAQFYGLTGLDEATDYLQHPTLGPRLEKAVAAVDDSGAASLRALLGSPDDLKFRTDPTSWLWIAGAEATPIIIRSRCSAKPEANDGWPQA
jgi:uncharacterized protein (DUF1810 family)